MWKHLKLVRQRSIAVEYAQCVYRCNNAAAVAAATQATTTITATATQQVCFAWNLEYIQRNMNVSDTEKHEASLPISITYAILIIIIILIMTKTTTTIIFKSPWTFIVKPSLKSSQMMYACLLSNSVFKRSCNCLFVCICCAEYQRHCLVRWNCRSFHLTRNLARWCLRVVSKMIKSGILLSASKKI